MAIIWRYAMRKEATYRATLSAPLGLWEALWCDKGLLMMYSSPQREKIEGEEEEALPPWLARAWESYWSGKEFEVPLCIVCPLSDFARTVYEAAAQIPFGCLLSYGSLAASIGRPNAARGVGSALRRNKWPLFVPCHRVIGADGSLKGYGGKEGLALKAALLRFEGIKTACP